MYRTIERLARLGLLASLFALAFGARPGAAQAQEASLYERLGGLNAITAVIDDFVANVAADNRINRFFANTDIPRLKRLLVEQVCEATGGPCTYTGRTMKDSHRGMGLSDADFNALVEDLVVALDKHNVGAREKNELLSALGMMRGDIVEVPGPGMPRTGGEGAGNDLLKSLWLSLLAGSGLVVSGWLIRRKHRSLG
jgi:hemoglobin